MATYIPGYVKYGIHRYLITNVYAHVYTRLCEKGCENVIGISATYIKYNMATYIPGYVKYGIHRYMIPKVVKRLGKNIVS